MPPEGKGGFIVAVVGESSLELQELLNRLDSGVVPLRETIRMGLGESLPDPGSGDDDEEDYRELLPPLNIDAALEADVVFLGDGERETRERLVSEASAKNVWVVDLGRTPVGEGWVSPSWTREELLHAGHHLCLPDPSATAIGLLRADFSQIGVTEMVVHRFLPASSRGQAAVMEFHSQAAKLLTFQPFPSEVLGGQWAFNLLPDDSDGSRRLFEGQIQALWPDAPPMMLVSLFSSMFHTTGLSVAVKPSVPIPEALEVLEDGLRDLPQFEGFDGGSLSTQDAVSTDKILAALNPSDNHWIQIWMVFDNVKVGRPSHAVTILETLTRAGQSPPSKP